MFDICHSPIIDWLRDNNSIMIFLWCFDCGCPGLATGGRVGVILTEVPFKEARSVAHQLSVSTAITSIVMNKTLCVYPEPKMRAFFLFIFCFSSNKNKKMFRFNIACTRIIKWIDQNKRTSINLRISHIFAMFCVESMVCLWRLCAGNVLVILSHFFLSLSLFLFFKMVIYLIIE